MVTTGRLYRKEDGDPLMMLCIDKEVAVPYLECAHVAIDNMHLSPKQTLERIRQMGVYWPTLYKMCMSTLESVFFKKTKVKQ